MPVPVGCFGGSVSSQEEISVVISILISVVSTVISYHHEYHDSCDDCYYCCWNAREAMRAPP